MKKELIINIDPRVDEKMQSYPQNIRPKIEYLRALIFESANEHADIMEIEETLKWNEPSYLVKKGSTLRIDWKEKSPNQYAMYFKCTSKLVLTFKEVYGDLFNYENNRAIVFKLDDEVPAKELKTCIKSALQYHKVKEIDNLGIELN